VTRTQGPFTDGWPFMSLARLVADSRAAFEEYDVRSARGQMEAFWDDLST